MEGEGVAPGFIQWLHEAKQVTLIFPSLNFLFCNLLNKSAYTERYFEHQGKEICITVFTESI